MKKALFILLIFTIAVNAQSKLKFVNYGSKSDPGEGDDNYIQVINIQLPQDYSGHAYIKLFDISCGSDSDVQFGPWNSTFRFSIYRGEHTEDSFLNIPAYRAEINDQIASHFEIGNDPRFIDSWYNWLDLAEAGSENNIFSLVIEGVEGNDGNNFELFISSDSLENKPIQGLKVYSYEPTLPLKKFSDKLSYLVKPAEGDGEITLHLFDFDGTKSYFSTILKNEIPVTENHGNLWSDLKFPLTVYEDKNYCSFDIGPEYKPVNDITFYFTDKNGNKLPIILPDFVKEKATVPVIDKNINYMDCVSAEFNVNASSSAGNKLNYNWSFEDGFNSTQTNFSRVLDKPGIYKGELYVEENSKAITRAVLEKFKAVINIKPVAVAGENQIGIPDKALIFNAEKSYDTDGKIVKFSWDFGDGGSAFGAKVSHSYSGAGKYVAKLKVEDDYLPVCNSSIDSVQVIINSAPLAIAKEYHTGAVNQIIEFDASASKDLDGSITKYTWDFYSLGNKEGIRVNQSFPKPGIYSVKLNVQDDSPASNNSVEKIIKVNINAAPKAVSGTSRIIAENEEISFDGSKSSDPDGQLIDYKWNFGDGGAESGVKVKHTYSKSGKYRIYLTVRDNSGTESETNIDSLEVIVNARPVAKIVNEVYLKDGNAKFDASSSFDPDGNISKYLWNFGDGTTGEGKIISHLYKAPGTYNIILKIVDNTNTSNNYSYDTTVVIINKKPIADAGPNHKIAPGEKLKFSGYNSVDPDGKIVGYRWFIDNKPVSEDSDFFYTFNTPGNFLVGLQVTDNFKYPAASYGYARVQVNSPSVPVIQPVSVIAPNQKFKLDASGSTDKDGLIKDYTWIFEGGKFLSGKIVDKSFDKPGIYSAILRVTDDAAVPNSVSYDTVYVKVNSSPIIKLNELIESCGSEITFDASKSIDPDGDDLTFIWDIPGSGKLKAGGLITHHFNETGIIPVTLTVDDGMNLTNSISKKTILVNIHRPPVADAGPDTTVCVGDILILNGLKSKAARNGLLQYEWTFDDSTKLSGSNVYKIFKQSGIYGVNLKVTDDSGLACNTGIDRRIIKVIDAPVANAGDDITACAGSPVKFDGSKSTSPGGSVNSYLWDFGDGETGGGSAPIHIYNKPGVYKVGLTITGDVESKCENMAKDEMNVTIMEAPLAAFASVDSVAENIEVTFDASNSTAGSANITNYTWRFGDDSTASGRVVKHKFKKYGIYTVQLNLRTDSKSECNTSVSSKLIYVNAEPVAKAKVKRYSSINESIEFDGSLSEDVNGMITKYMWDFGDGSTAEGIKVAHSYSNSGIYKVVLTVLDDTGLNNNAAKDYSEVEIISSPGVNFTIPDKSKLNSEHTLTASIPTGKEKASLLYEWFLNDSKIADGQSIKIKFIKPGINKVRLSIKDKSNGVSIGEDLTRYIQIPDRPKLSLPKNVTICPDEQLKIDPVISMETDNSGLKYTWRSGDGKIVGNSISLNLINLPGGKYHYTLELADTYNQVFARDSVSVFVNEGPRIPALSDTTVYIGYANDGVLFDAEKVFSESTDYLKINWDFGDGTNSDLPSVLHRYAKEAVYKVELTADDQKNTKCSKVISSFFVTVKKSM